MADYFADDALTDRKGWLRRGVGLALRYMAQRLDQRDILREHVSALASIHSMLVELRGKLAPVGMASGTVLVLWPASDEKSGPGCVGRTFPLPPDPETAASFEVPLYWPVPEGAWVVALDCVLTGVHIGADTHDLGPMPRGKVVRLRRTIALGDRLQLELKREVGPRSAPSSRYAS